MTTEPKPPPDADSAGASLRDGRLWLLVAAHAVGTLHSVSVLAMAPVIRQDLALSATQIGLLMTAYNGAQAMMSMPAGGLADRLGVGRTVMAAHAFLVCGAVTLSMAQSFAFVVLAMVLMGTGYAMVNPASGKGVNDWFSAERRATAMGIKQTGVPIGGVLAAANGALVVFVGWQSIMWGIAAATALSGLAWLGFSRRPIAARGQTTRRVLPGLLHVMRDSNFNVFVALSGLFNFGQANFFAYLTLFMRDVVMASQPVAGLAVGIAQASSAIARVGWSVVSDTRFRGRRRPLKAMLGAAAVAFFVILASIEPGAPVVLGLGMAFLLGVSVASYAPLTQTLAVEAVEARYAGTATGYSMTGVHIGGMTGPPLFGLVVDLSGGYASGWLLTAAAVAAGVGLLAWGFRERAGR